MTHFLDYNINDNKRFLIDTTLYITSDIFLFEKKLILFILLNLLLFSI
jgi:hypothetical protein